MSSSFKRFPPLRRDGATIELCNLFMTRSVETWTLLRRARAANLGFKEESITDMHLLAFKECGLEGFDVHSFTRQDERANGADYEFWFLDRTGTSLGVRVQAKRVDNNEDLKALNYLPTTATSTQSQTLLDVCRKEDMLPAYCIYVYSEAFLEPGHGCSLLSPWIVSAFPSNRTVSLEKVNYSLVPWSVLVCRSRGKWDSPTAAPSLTCVVAQAWRSAIGYGHEHRPPEIEVSDEWQSFGRDIFKASPPLYVLRLIDAGTERQAMVEEQLVERNLRGVVVIRETR
jgi:hypothetical protein